LSFYVQTTLFASLAFHPDIALLLHICQLTGLCSQGSVFFCQSTCLLLLPCPSTLLQNEKKFEDARLDFISYNCLVSRSLWDLWRNRFLIMDPIFDQVIKTKSMFIQAMGNQLSSVLPELKRCLAIPVHVDESLPPVLRAPPPDGLGKDVDERKLELRMRQAAEKIQVSCPWTTHLHELCMIMKPRVWCLSRLPCDDAQHSP
jgi:hypothetical protein